MKPARMKAGEFAKKDDPRVKDLQQTNQRLMRQLERVRRSQEELVDAVYRAAHDAVSSIDLPVKVTAPKNVHTNKTPEVAAIALSDWQLAKRTPSYSSAICEQAPF